MPPSSFQLIIVLSDRSNSIQNGFAIRARVDQTKFFGESLERLKLKLENCFKKLSKFSLDEKNTLGINGL